jgi:hypothetical protein
LTAMSDPSETLKISQPPPHPLPPFRKPFLVHPRLITPAPLPPPFRVQHTSKQAEEAHTWSRVRLSWPSRLSGPCLRPWTTSRGEFTVQPVRLTLSLPLREHAHPARVASQAIRLTTFGSTTSASYQLRCALNGNANAVGDSVACPVGVAVTISKKTGRVTVIESVEEHTCSAERREDERDQSTRRMQNRLDAIGKPRKPRKTRKQSAKKVRRTANPAKEKVSVASSSPALETPISSTDPSPSSLDTKPPAVCDEDSNDGDYGNWYQRHVAAKVGRRQMSRTIQPVKQSRQAFAEDAPGKRRRVSYGSPALEEVVAKNSNEGERVQQHEPVRSLRLP